MSETEDLPGFGAMMRDLRERRGMSLRGTSIATDGAITRQGIAFVEEENNPKLLTLIALAEVYRARIVIDPDGVLVEDLEE